MLRNRRSRRRRGVVLVEAGFVYSAAILLILGTIVMGFGVFRYQQVSWLACEGARWASVRGPEYQADQTAAAPTAAEVMAGAINSRLISMDPGDLEPTLTWHNASTPKTVTFTLKYTWTPQMFGGAKTLTGTSTQVVTY